MSLSLNEDDFDFGSDNEGSGSDNETHTKFSNLQAELEAITKSSQPQVKRKKSAKGTGRCLSSGSSGVDFGELSNALKVKQSKIAAPNSKYEQKRVNRKRGYAEISEEVNKWEGVVDQHRKAEHISFPLKEESIAVIKSEKFEPCMKTNLQKELYTLLGAAKVIKTKQETAQEKAIREAMSLEEIKERNDEAWKLRILMNKIGKKNFLKNKTKSKKYHKILKKDRMKKEAKDLETLQKNDPKLAAKKLEEMQNIRAEERMSLRHKKSKWSQNMQLRAKTDSNALEALKENDRLHREYKQKLVVEEESEDSSSGEDEEMSEGDEADINDKNEEPAPSVDDSSFAKMKEYWLKVNEKKSERVKAIMEENRKKKKIAKMSEEERANIQVDEIIENKLSEAVDEEMEEEPKITEFTFSAMDKPSEDIITETSQRKQNLNDFEDMECEEKKNLVQIATSKHAEKTEEKQLCDIDESNFTKINTKRLAKMGDNILNLMADDEEESDGDENLFEEDEFAMTQFKEEKEAVESENNPKDLDTYKPGWGNWTGPGIKEDKKTREKFIFKAPKKQKSKFSDKINVLYNEKSDVHNNIRNRMVTQLPYPFRNVRDYEASLQGSIGRQFVPELVHRDLVKPAVTTKLGTVIKPMDKSQLLQMPHIEKAVNIKMKELKSGENKKPKEKPKKLINIGEKRKKKIGRKSKL